MSRTIRKTHGHVFRRPKTTNAKRQLCYVDADEKALGIKAIGTFSFVSSYDDKIVSAVYETPNAQRRARKV